MEIDLTEKQCIDIEWSILIAVDSVQQRYLKEKKEIDRVQNSNSFTDLDRHLCQYYGYGYEFLLSKVLCM